MSSKSEANNLAWTKLIEIFGSFPKAVAVLELAVQSEPQSTHTVHIDAVLQVLSLLKQITPSETIKMDNIISKTVKYYYWVEDEDETSDDNTDL